MYVCLLLSMLCMACTDSEQERGDGQNPSGQNPSGSDGNENGGEDDLHFEGTIREYEGERADDAANDTVGTDKDFYWEANTFATKVTVVFDGATARVSTGSSGVEFHTEGAHVVLDMQTNAVSGVEVAVYGKSDDGSLKIYGASKYKLTLAGVELTSQRGPAINSQCKKRVYVHLADGRTNRLGDCKKYTDDIWYPEGSNADLEDRKGAFFSEGNLIFSGTGVLEVAGRKKHGIASDGYMYTRPGVTIAVTEAAKNAIHIKGDATDNIGILITGGFIHADVASEAGKGMKTDLHAEVSGGKLDLRTSGNAVYEADEADTSSAAGIKTDGNIVISGGTISVTSTGTGGKGLNADGSITFAGGETVISTSGGKYYYSTTMTSSPKGVKADGDITVSGGRLDISVTGASDGSEGLESKAALTVDGGEIYVHAYDDAINAASGIEVNGGRIYAYSVSNDGIDSNGYLYFNGGLSIAVGASAPEESFDCDTSSRFVVNGGTLVGVAGGYMSTPASSSKQRVVLYSSIQASQNENIAVLDASGDPIMTFTVPRQLNSLVLFFSSPDIASGKTYTVSRGGSVSGYTDSWYGWYGGGKWSNGSTVGTFTSNSIVTTVGSSGGRPGGPGGRP